VVAALAAACVLTCWWALAPLARDRAETLEELAAAEWLAAIREEPR